MPSTPVTVRTLLEHLDASAMEAKALAAGLTDPQCNWQPAKGRKWSVGQCLDHLRLTTEVYGTAIRAAAEASPFYNPSGDIAIATSTPIKPGLLSRLFLALAEPPPRVKVPAPSMIQPASDFAKQQVLQSFLDSIEWTKQLAVEASCYDLNRVRFSNPFIRGARFTVGTGLMIIAAHNRRHLWQARQVLADPEFPR